MLLDASAVLARVFREPGAERVAASLPGASVSAVNYAEIVGKLIDLGVPVEAAVAVGHELGLAVVAFDEADAAEAGLLRVSTRAFGLSLGDRACLALARRLRQAVLTADRAWAELDLGIEVVLIR